MNTIKKLSLFALTLFSFAQGHIFEAEKWVNQSNQTVSLFGDYHVAENEENQVNDVQQAALIDIAKNLNATIIVEDGYSNGAELKQDPLNYDYNKYRKFEVDNPHEITLLAGFTGRCKEEGVKVNNIEFRFPPLATSAHMIMAKIEQIKQKITTYNDNALNDYYKRKLEELRTEVEIPCASLLNELKNSYANLEESCHKIHYKKEYDQALYHLWGHAAFADMYDKVNHIIIGYEARLVDLEILHAIAQQNSHAIICAGAGHLNRIKPALKEIGFASVKSMGEQHIGNAPEPRALNITQTVDAFYSADEMATAQQQANALKYFTPIALVLCVLLVIATLGALVVVRHARTRTQIQSL